MGILDLGAQHRAWSVDAVLDDLDPARRDHLKRFLDDSGVPTDEIIRACAEDGYVVTAWSIVMHRRRERRGR